MSTIFNTLLVYPFINLLLLFYNIFSSVSLPGPLGWSIIAITLVVRSTLNPVMNKQYESSRKMQELQPKIKKIQQKYKNDKQRQQTEIMKMQKEHGVNPASGCLPLLLQMPIIYALFAVFRQILMTGSAEEIVAKLNQIAYVPFLHVESLDLTFFGIDLAIRPNQWHEFGVWLLAIPVVTSILTLIQSKRMMALQSKSNIKKELKKKAEEKSAQDTAADMQKQMVYIMPFMIGFFAYSFSIGISLYWNTSTLFAIIAYEIYIRNREKAASPKR